MSKYKIHFNVLYPIQKINIKKMFYIFPFFIVVFLLMKALGLSKTIIGPVIIGTSLIIALIMIIFYNIKKTKVISKAYISSEIITLGDEKFFFDDIIMCWINFGYKSKLRENDIAAGFEDCETLQMTIIDKNRSSKTYHVENEREYPKTLMELLIQLKTKNSIDKIQFHKSNAFEITAFERRMEMKKQYKASFVKRQLRKVIRK